MSGITIGVTIHPQHTTTDELLATFQQADAMGIDTLWTWDHFFPLTGDLNGTSFEAWSVLSACGVQTKRAQIGCLVHGIGYRNPALLSAMAKTLDHFLGGRLILGLGAGWHERDYVEYGYDYGTKGSRLRDLERGIEIIKARWAIDNPKPPRGAVPIMVGGSGEKVTLRIVAQHADLWHSNGTPEEWVRKSGILDGWCAQVGRDPKAIKRSVSVFDQRFESKESFLADLNSRLDAYAETGVDDLLLGLGAPYDLRILDAALNWRSRRG
jgi:probable F420-dependent oxidoreductase